MPPLTDMSTPRVQQNLLGKVLLLRENSQHKVSFMVGLERGWDDAVLAGWELVAAAHLAQVDERRRLGHRRVVLEEAHVEGLAGRFWLQL